MNRLAALLLMAVGLAAVIALEVISAPHADVAVSQPRAAIGATQASPPYAEHAREWITTVLARPLFSPDRRPAADATSATGRSLPGLPRLAGVMVGPFGRSAIFALEGSKPIVVQEGGAVAAYRVKSIEPEEVRLIGPDGVEVLKPSFAQGPNKVAGAAASPGRSNQAPLPR